MLELLGGWTSDMWGPVINLFSFIPSYAWMLVVFTILLKIVLSPLDFWQRKVSRDSMIKQAKLQPEIEKLQKKFGNNQQMLNQQTMLLYKREKYNVVGSCLSMILNMAITLFVFITLFTALGEISSDKMYKQYTEMQASYNTTYQAEFVNEYGLDINGKSQNEINVIIEKKENELIDAQKTIAEQKLLEEHAGEDGYTPTEAEINVKAAELAYLEEGWNGVITKAQEEASKKYEEVKDEWLWVKNIWRPDTAVAAFPDFDAFMASSSFKTQEYYTTVMNDEGLTEAEKKAIMDEWRAEYNVITAKAQTNYASWNGCFLLVVLAGVVTYLSSVITQRMSGNNQATGGMKFMKWLLPILMVIFTISYSAAFALYIVVNAIMSLIFSLIATKIFNKKGGEQPQIEVKTQKRPNVEYSR